ncbi:MAG: hypothetical protein GWP18_02935 [Proteobacteria bacterium]|nr:hypothetical protein [Pseudomonadota bacterium]
MVAVELAEPNYSVEAPPSDLTFPEGEQWRIEIPSVEGPEAVRVVLDESARLGVPVHRISQGSGIQMLLDNEITEMHELCADADIELCLFVGPRGSFDIGAAVLARAGGALKGALRGARQLHHAIADVERATDLGIRSILVADLGLLALLNQRRESGGLPADFIFKYSVLAAPANPASAAVLSQLGADTLNIPSDLSIRQIAEIRQATDAVIDFYVEAPDDIGGFVRFHDIPDLVRVGAPIYLKFGLRNAPVIYPSGDHLSDVVLSTARERVRRARIGVDHLRAAGLIT